MALLIRGRSICPICKNVIAEEDDVFSFPALITNSLDPLYEFNDSVFHAGCFHGHPLSARAIAVMTEWETRSSQKKCAIGGGEITDPEDLFVFPFMAQQGLLANLNFASCSRKALESWDRLEGIIWEMRELSNSREWDAAILLKVVKELEQISSTRNDP